MSNGETTPLVRIGTAGWAVRKDLAHLYGATGSHLARHAGTFDAVEINSSFYKPHRRATYERWAASVPRGFRFAVKMPRAITHERRLVDCDDLLARFLDESSGLGDRLGPLLVQFPASFAFDAARVVSFLESLRARFDDRVACEPRHASWFEDEVDGRLAALGIAIVAADPACVPRAAAPGGWRTLAYFRLHGSPEIYRSRYGPERIALIAARLRAAVARASDTWCIFDNTALGAAPLDALELQRELARSSPVAG